MLSLGYYYPLIDHIDSSDSLMNWPFYVRSNCSAAIVSFEVQLFLLSVVPWDPLVHLSLEKPLHFHLVHLPNLACIILKQHIYFSYHLMMQPSISALT